VARAFSVVAAPDSERNRQPVDGAGERAHGDARRALGAVEQRPHHLPSRGVAQGVQHAVARMGAFAREVELATLAVEAGTPGRELADALRPLLDQDARRRCGHDPGPGLEGVVEVQIGRVVRSHGDGHSPLRVAGVALGGLVLRHHQHLSVAGQTEGRTQAGDAGAQHEEVDADEVI
jgi:hypothetical protein